MSILEQRFPCIDGLFLNVRQSEMSGNSKVDSLGLDKKISRVLRLRDMFQTGIIRPIEEIDDPVTPPMSPVDKQLSDERLRFLSSPRYCAQILDIRMHQSIDNKTPSPLQYSSSCTLPRPLEYCVRRTQTLPNVQTFPGSPPLSTLRAHQANVTKAQTTGTKNLTKEPTLTNGTSLTPPRPSVLASNSGPSSPVPPATPPKPNYLPADISPALQRAAAFSRSKMSNELQKSIAIFENTHASAQPATQNGPAKPTRTTPTVAESTNGSLVPRRSVFQQNSRTDTLQAPPQNRRVSSPPQLQTQGMSVTVSIPPKDTVPKILANNTAIPNLNGSSSQAPLSLDIPPTSLPCSGSTPKPSPLSMGVNDSDQNETEYESVESSRPNKLATTATPGKLSSWQGTSDLDRISPAIPGGGPYQQDFILQPDAFRTSPTYMLEAARIDHSMPTLQHAEPVAVLTPDEEDDSDDLMERPTCPSPRIPVPPSLKVVAVDPEGFHILEDGNFVYAAPGLSCHHDSSSEESNVVVLRSRLSPDDIMGSAHEDNESFLSNSSRDGLNKRVRFSGDPILIFSTYSTSEYDRRNDEVDPLAASAEYELEKHLEEMDLFNVDLQKSAQGLGISILGLGVDNVGGEQKLGIFIKALTPGGAAEANGKIMVYDQIVEVDGVSLVGVSQQFAAQTLRGTKDVVHFVLAREKDPSNSRIAQLLAEQEQDDQVGMERAPNPLARSPDSRDEPVVRTETIPRDDSLETLHKMLSDAENAARHPESLMSEEDETTDLSALGPSTLLRDTDGSSDQLLQTQDTSASPATDLDRSGSSDSTGPRSALKGTATAASTKRRQDALQQLIRSAEERAKSEAAIARLPPLVPGVDQVTWILANDLYDCHSQLLKAQTQLQSLEQRLATQEAAAEETIERLCMQCRHMENKLNEAHSRLQHYVQAHQEGRLHFTEINVIPESESNGHPPHPAEYKLVSDPASTELSNSTPSANVDHDAPCLVVSQPELERSEVAVGEAYIQRAVSADNTSAVAGKVQLDTWTQKQVEDRARLISTGGLSNRRPRTRVVINPPPTLLHDSSAAAPPTVASSLSDVTYVQSVTQHLLFPVPTGQQSSPEANKPDAGSAGDHSPVTDGSSINSPDTAQGSSLQTPVRSDPSQCSPLGGSTIGTPDSSSSRPSSHKALGIQLPGLSPGMLQSVNLRRRSPTPDQPAKGDKP